MPHTAGGNKLFVEMRAAISVLAILALAGCQSPDGVPASNGVKIDFASDALPLCVSAIEIIREHREHGTEKQLEH
jgi:hypothetical protein